MGWPRQGRDYNTVLQLALFQKQWKHSLTFNILPHATCLLQPRHAVAGMQGKQSEHHANGLHFPSTTKKISITVGLFSSHCILNIVLVSCLLL